MKKAVGITIIFLFFLTGLSAEEQNYTNSSIARLSHTTGNTYIQRAADLSFEEAAVNMPISEGDRLGTTDGRTEVYISKSNYIRLDQDTKIDFLSLPKKGSELIQVRIWSGNVYFSINYLEKEKNIEVHTSDVSFYVLDTGLYRIDVRENMETEVFVFNGLIEAAGETGSVLIKDAQRLEAIEGRFTSHPTRFMAVAEDSFDRWSEYRDSQVRKRMAQQYLPDELEDFEYELDAYGDWVYLPSYGNVWVPGGVARDWRPYYNGRWVWLSLTGWTWYPYEPWGWATFHYGRWHWRVGLGWYWIPTNIWGPGWVSWYWGYDYFGWAPMSYYGYPGVIINNVYYGRYSRSQYPYNSRALTVIHKNQLKARNVSKVALKQDSVKKLGKISLSKKMPTIKPEKTKISVQKLEGKKVFLQNKSDNVNFKPRQITRPLKSKGEKTGSVVTNKDTARSSKLSPDRKITKIRTGYPSSPDISTRKITNRVKSKRSSSVLGRIYKSISRGSTKYLKSGSSKTSSRGTTSKKISSRSKSQSTSKGKSTSTRSRSSSGSSKTKKKK